MDSARTVPRHPLHPPPPPHSQYSSSAPLPPPPPLPPSHQYLQHQAYQQQQHQQQHYQPAPVASNLAQPGFAPVDPRAHQPPSHSSVPQSTPPSYYTQGTSLPPIFTRDSPAQQPGYHSAPPHPHALPDSGPLPPFRPSSAAQHSPHDAAREHVEHTQTSGAQSRSGNATPASALRSQESLIQQRTPSTPAQPGSYPAGVVPEPSRTPSQHMDHAHPSQYPPQVPHTNGLHAPIQTAHHEGQPSYAPTPIMEHHPPPYPVHAQVPIPQQPMYQPGYAPAPSYTSSTPSVTNKRKPMRAQQACEQCRQRKQKCDEGQPCSFCREQNINCNYRDPGPAKADKNTESMMQKMDAIMGTLQDISARLARVESGRADAKSTKSISPLPKSESDAMDQGPEVTSGAVAPAAAPAAAKSNRSAAKSEDWGDHRTGAHNLIMLWPSVRPLFSGMHDKYDSSYVWTAEDRGLLRVHGKGAGVEDQDGPQIVFDPSSPAPSDDSGDTAPTPREGLWGRGFIGNTTSDVSRPTSLDGGLNPDGSLDLSKNTVVSLFDSFMKHMYIMHPFLDKRRARKMTDNFMANYSPGRPSAGFANGPIAPLHGESNRPLKRPRVDAASSITNMSTPDSTSRVTPLSIEHSPTNAIVLLMLALGKICQYDKPLPGPNENKSNANQTGLQSFASHSNSFSSSPVPLTMKPSPVSPKSTPVTHPTPPDFTGNRIESRSRRSSDTASSHSAKNPEFIPGLAYYAKAVEIIGGQVGGCDLLHAQMYLLAALYKSQLARVRESMEWLYLAGKVCHGLILRHRLYRVDSTNKEEAVHKIAQMLKDKRIRLIVVASWSCLQLEADVLAELPFPASLIQKMEEQMISPLMSWLGDDEYADAESSNYDNSEDVLIENYYRAQLFLRRRLNHVHRLLYGEELRNENLSRVQETMYAQQRELVLWRASTPPELKWDDQEPPANNILAARLRAKYYGAMYVIHRPFLDYALHILPQIIESTRTVEEAAFDAEGNPRPIADVKLFKVIQSMDKATIWENAKKCVEAALKSTVALDGMKGRLKVTNIHGTSHAQFGNMLVLAATYSVTYTQQLITKEQLEPQMERTIRFLKKLAPISPTAAIDCSILEQIRTKLFTPPDVTDTPHDEKEPSSASNSFSV